MFIHVNRILCIKIHNTFHGSSAIIHAELLDHWMTNLHSARMGYHNLDLSVDVISMAMEDMFLTPA